MTRQDFSKLCESIGFCKQNRELCVGSYYAGLNSNMFGPTLIYLPEEEDKVYISLSIYIYENNSTYRYKHGITIPGKNAPYSMKEIYPAYELSDDKTIKQALFNLQKMYKNQMNLLQKEKINGDFE